ncbi:AbrB family transcriptional regulator [Rhizobium sp. SG2393]|uniref:AbrB family transcriptional regulator n=1 Tax=Rhizobium sp. SG2393 TaxID=3276279 RepID=UPI00366D675D
MPAIALRWLSLIALSLAITLVLEAVRLPAALLIGPMAAGIMIALAGVRLSMPAFSRSFAQAVIGVMIATTVTADILVTFAARWPLFLATIVAVIAVSALSGYALARLKVLPATTAIWGSSAGAASAMVLMAQAYGADARLVGFMQYLRVIFVASIAAIVARTVAGVTAGTPAHAFFEMPDYAEAMTAAAIALAGTLLGRATRLPAGLLLGPLVLGAVLHVAGLSFYVPELVLALAYALLGWTIGLGFDRDVLLHAGRALVPVTGAILLLIGFCGLLAYALHVFAGIDPLTAYLATSPGGMDSIAIIAASIDVDVPFIMALQTARLLIVMAIGPTIARLLADRLMRR